MGDLVAGTALITGGGSGIGRAVAYALALQGAPVALVDLLAGGGQEAVAAIQKEGGRAAFFRGDVSQWADVDRIFSQVGSELGPVGILVNAAGILDGYTSADALEPAVWERVIGINLTGTFLCCKRALTDLLKADAGRIINIASTAGLVGAGGGPAYVASKHGVVGLTRQLGVEFAPSSVTVNAICPGPIQTALRANSTQILGADAPPMGGLGADEAALRAAVPAGRRGTLDEIASAVSYLASKGAAYVTGTTLVVDGGWTAR